MRTLLSVAASLLLVQGLRAENYTVRVQETAIVEIAGATAAYTTNPDIADVTIAGAGRVSVTGHSTGTTQLIVISAGNSQSFLITVAAVTHPAAAPEAGAAQVRYEGRYSSGIGRLQNGVDVTTHDGTRSTELHILEIHNVQATRSEPSDIIASIFYRTTAPGRVLTLLDDVMDVSRTTVDNTQVRGIHLRDGSLELHAGYASSAEYDGFFLPTDRRWVGGGGYGIDFRGTRWTPSVYAFFSEPRGTGARRGVVAALTAEHRRGDSLFIRGDLGVSRSVAANGEIRYMTARSQLRAFLSQKPDDYPTLGLSDIPGTHGDVDWSQRATDRLSITSAGTFDRFRFAVVRETISSARAAARYAITPRLMISAGGEVSEVTASAGTIRTVGLPLGISYDGPQRGLAASYRLIDSSSTSRRGDALRISARAGGGRITANIWAERQRQVPTLDLIFSAEPGLELALLRLGITARTPEDVARALRDNAALIDLGFITGVNVNLTPRRVQAGVNLAWSGPGAYGDHLRLLAVFGQDQGIRARNDTFLTSLSYSRRVLRATDLFASYSWWRAGAASRLESGNSLELGLRQQFNGVPDFLQRGGSIVGFVFLDPEMGGIRGPHTTPLGDVAVTLDGSRTTRTGATGSYAFDHVAAGTHQIAVQLPSGAHGFFTTPSRTSVKPPAQIDFGLTWAAARIDGHLIGDGGMGIAGAVFSATPPGGVPISVTSDAEGHFVFAVAAGTLQIALAMESLPAGYLSAGEVTQRVTVEADQPRSISFHVNAIRSVSGKASGATEVAIESLARTAKVDADGNFVFRSMPAGTYVLKSRSAGRTASATVTLPPGPATIGDIDLTAGAQEASRYVTSPPAAPAVTDVPLIQRRPAAQAGGYWLQAGAFRLASNTSAAVQKIERLAAHAVITRSGPLDLVTVGPFPTTEVALAEAVRLRHADIEVIFLGDRGAQQTIPPLTSGQHIVQAGAFRESRYASELIAQLQKTGKQPFTFVDRGLTIVCIGPFDTRRDAVMASERLHRAGFDGLVVRR